MKKSFAYMKKAAWILLLCFPFAKAWPQLTPAIDRGNDSTIRAEFLANARRINQDLIKGDFAAKRAESLAAQLKLCSDGSVSLQAQASASARAATEAQDQARKAAESAQIDRQKRKMARLENWGWRFLALLALYKTIHP